jgi:two-component system chemotaxis response regulator CheB
LISLKPKKLILIGASTGGPGLIEKIISSLPTVPINAAIVIAQHMNRVHLDSFSKRLNRINPIKVTFVSEKTTLLNGQIFLLEDTTTLQFEYGNIYLEKESLQKGYYHPTIDELFCSAAKLTNIEINAYLLSGIGADGAKGLLSLKDANCRTVAQDEKTSIVYGMPKSAFELGAHQYIMSIDEIIEDIHKELA